ncbi:Maf family protein [Polymorphobacter fuscus]|uniref:Nucleoside triphosphate pyrophosphatase n=1 Tax=Sandarakinorhabdus fusca TaxID=1439888 RepID=A0A7C9GPR4_9SPHN|nr:Maf family protein [Polymorphobacter fuscus]KAB7647647.1 septum formation protein Maf [Polymorphobacter fuscus]MQT16930.1 septum formation protein Maf [Polymorphobacter fuscus]NJC09080.1 septum formation protein [Polymorphobacter fuscus]
MIVLASQSPARRAMLAAAGVAHDAVPAHVDEDGVTAGLVAAGATPDRIADALAELKAVKIARKLPGVLVLGADSVVVAADGGLIAKPETRAGAEAQLRRLSGATHRLISAAVIAENGEPVWRAGGSVRLTMRSLSDAFIADYLDAEGDAVLGCVGCYRIEGLGAQLFTRVDGDQFTVRGLPLLAVLGYLRDRGVLAT